MEMMPVVSRSACASGPYTSYFSERGARPFAGILSSQFIYHQSLDRFFMRTDRALCEVD